MTSTAAKILEAALLLSEDERERLADALVATLRRDAPEDVARAWDHEVADRVRAAERDGTPGEEWDAVYAALRAKHQR